MRSQNTAKPNPQLEPAADWKQAVEGLMTADRRWVNAEFELPFLENMRRTQKPTDKQLAKLAKVRTDVAARKAGIWGRRLRKGHHHG